MSTDVLALPVYAAAPTGPQWRLLRRMTAEPIRAVAVGPARVLCVLGGHEVSLRLVAGLLARDLVEERPVGGECGQAASEYHLTAEGMKWATKEPTEATS